MTKLASRNLRQTASEAVFDEFAREHTVRFTDALVARFGVEVGPEVAAIAIAHAWEHWSKVATMENRLGYLFRVAQSSARPHHRWNSRRATAFPAAGATSDSYADPDLSRALAKLPGRQRVCVLLLHAYGWSQRDVALLLGISESMVNNDAHRGRARLKTLLDRKGDE
jgi:RNA polymerase sigma factor (sigma-70 family)